MFKGFLHKTKQVSNNPVIKASKVFSVQKASTLLADPKRQEFIKEMRALLNLPPKLFDALYLSAIEHFAEFVQTIPVTRSGIFAHDGGFLDYGLERAARALSLVLNYFFPQEKTLQKASSNEALWIYAVFTAALLFDVGKIAVKFQINLCQKDGSLPHEWLPYTGPMTLHGKFYKYDFVKENRDRLQHKVTALLARQLLATDETSTGGSGQSGGSNGFNWIASNTDILEAWLDMLSNISRPVSSFMTLIPIAEGLTVQNYLANLKTSYNNVSSSASFELKTDDQSALAEIAAAETFLRWLQQGLSNKTITVNEANSHIHVGDDGVFINPEIFKVFSQQNPQHHNSDSVEQQFRQFMEVFLAPYGETGQRYSRIGGISTISMDKYLLIYNPCLLFGLGQIPPVNPSIVKMQNQITKQPKPENKHTFHANLLRR